MFNQEIRTNYIFNAHKPSNKNYEKAMKIMGTDKQIHFCRRSAVYRCLGERKEQEYIIFLWRPINPKEEIQIVLKRYLEKIVLHFYEKKD